MSKQSTQQPTAASPISPYTGAWDLEKAAHLLRRTVLGPSLKEIKTAQQAGLSATLDLLLKSAPIPDPPVKYRNDYDEYVQLGQTWINASYKGSNQYRGMSLKGWYYNNMMRVDQTNIQERMCFFWLNYFAISGPLTDHRAMYKELRLYQELAVGNFRTMLQRIAVEPRMLFCLDGHTNHKKNPNENFAREVMELFTVGKGELAGEGDYTTFTEQDVAALARAFTGWRNKDFLYSDYDIPVESYFDSAAHDTGDKQLSHRFGNKVIRNGGANEYKQVIDILLSSKAAALNFCKRLYRYFVYYDIDDDVLAHVIYPLADTLIANNFEVKPVLRQLLSSQHFYGQSIRGAVIKNPHDFICSMVRPFGEFWHETKTLNLQRRYELGNQYANYCTELQLEFLEPPSISGWKAYYDAPQYYRHWLSPALMQSRDRIALDNILDEDYHIKGDRIDLDYYSYVRSLSDPHNVDKVVEETVLVFLPRPITSAQTSKLRNMLLRGAAVSDWNWLVTKYIQNPGVDTYSRPVDDRLRDFFKVMFGFAEFQLQ
ncbi:uncharacterized protein (DUF1800 family) [Lewinella aquimaris]|uniref:Uncharacterized protein (DUF1800 family) n=1 Tax=Neolewinella aquimaris TaxID=1835722 RepID=A0A840E0I2_9BACT|nr:DUF1800 family protein [Neolewinella aquimaris]MBB4079014.1 uncharacterized protein (DUF1800 family) [Neolewinella aquimaris]